MGRRPMCHRKLQRGAPLRRAARQPAVASTPVSDKACQRYRKRRAARDAGPFSRDRVPLCTYGHATRDHAVSPAAARGSSGPSSAIVSKKCSP
jgi:hypothetical protein